MKLFCIVVVQLFLLGVLFAQNQSAAGIYQGIKKLNVLGSVLYIAAHPDDENTRLLTYFSKDQLYRTGYLSLTRGDGGQNLIGDEQGIPLGLIRTQELLAARKIDGAEQFFTRAYDFGYSKTPEETFTKWDREKVLADVVWIIRNFKPDVIITRFPVTGEGGHGHHTASAILANEAFLLAADSNAFPEQLKYVQPWQAKRILWNTFNFGGNNTTNNSQFHFDVGGYNPVLGASYGEIAAESRSQHKSQGFGSAKSRGTSFEYFETTGGPAPVHNLFDGVNTSWQRVSGGEAIQQLVNKTIEQFNFSHPQNSLDDLLAVYRQLKAMPEGYWRNLKLSATADLIAQAGGLWLEANAAVQNAVQGDSLSINIIVNDRSGVPMKLKEVRLENDLQLLDSLLQPNTNVFLTKKLFVNPGKPISQPYWLREPMQNEMFVVPEQQLIGQAQNAPAYQVQVTVQIGSDTINFARPVQYKSVDPVKGERYEPVFVIPPTTIFALPQHLLFKKGSKQQKPVSVHLVANTIVNASRIEARLRSKYYAIAKAQTPGVLLKNTDHTYRFFIGNENMRNNESDFLQPFADVTTNNQTQYAYLAMTGIQYDHIPTIRYFYPSGVRLLNIDLNTYHKKIGYIVGAGDKVPEALEQMGYTVTLLSQNNFAQTNLQQFDAIITGVRAYNVNEWLNSGYDKLMQYVKNGGNLVVQYNTNNNLGPVKAKIGPFPFTITRNRVTDENATVTFLQPQHRVLNFPNKITEKDFEGWVQERSTYHAADLDSNFQKILSMHDAGEAPNDGSLVIARYGKGFFTYTGLVFFRELPAGVPGAYRLFANIIALNYKKSLNGN